MTTLSKTVLEIFKEEYSPFNVTANKLIASESLGFIKATLEYFPWLKKELQPYKELAESVLYNTTLVNKNEWTEAIGMSTLMLGEALEIIEDSLCHGFEFKISNGKVYFREAQ